MRGIEHTEGYWFPWAVTGSQFEQAELWDGETYFVDGSRWTPSNSSSTATPVVGPRTAWWLGLTAQEMAFAWWRIDRWRQKFVDTISITTPKASISADFSPTDQFTYSRLTATTTLPFFRSDRRALIRAVRSGQYVEGGPKFSETPGALMTVAPLGFSVAGGASFAGDWDSAENGTSFYSFPYGSDGGRDTIMLDGAYSWSTRGVRYCPADGKYYICMPTLSMYFRARSEGNTESRTVAVKMPVYERPDLPGVWQQAYFTGPGRKWATGPLGYVVMLGGSVRGKQRAFFQTPATAYGAQDLFSSFPAPSFLPSGVYLRPDQITGEESLTYTFAKGTPFEKVVQVPVFKRVENVIMPRAWAADSLFYTPNLGDSLVQDSIIRNGSVGEDVPDNVGWGIYNLNGSLFSWDQLELPAAGNPATYQTFPTWIETISSRSIAIELSPSVYYGYGGVYNTTTGAYIPPA